MLGYASLGCSVPMGDGAVGQWIEARGARDDGIRFDEFPEDRSPYVDGCCSIRIGATEREALLCASSIETEGRWMLGFSSLHVVMDGTLRTVWQAPTSVAMRGDSISEGDPSLTLDAGVRADGRVVRVGVLPGVWDDSTERRCEEAVALAARWQGAREPLESPAASVLLPMLSVCGAHGDWHLGRDGVYTQALDAWLRARGVERARLPSPPALPDGVPPYGGGCRVRRLGEGAAETLVCRSAVALDESWVTSFTTLLAVEQGRASIAWHGPTAVRATESRFHLLSIQGPEDPFRASADLALSADGRELTVSGTACAADAPSDAVCRSVGRFVLRDGTFVRSP